MNLKNNKIAIAYRIYPKISKVPPIFSDDKLKLSELCLSSFANALKDIDYKVWVILDNCPPEYHAMFKKYLKDDTELIDTPGIGNPGTFGKQMEILLNQDFSENIYFAEDDYFYRPNAFNAMLNFANSQHNPDFITPYDHLDYYNLDLHQYPKTNIKFSDDINWRSEGSTCMTFFTKKEILRRTYSVFETYTRKNYDGSLWLALTKKKLFNPLIYPKYLFTNFALFKILAKAWIYTPLKLIFGKQHSLYARQPSLSTHMDSQFLAPDINWENLFEQEKKVLCFEQKKC